MEIIGLVLFVITIIFLLAYGFFRTYTNIKKRAAETVDNKIKAKMARNKLPSKTLDYHKFEMRSSMTVIVSLSILVCSLYIILSGKYDSGTQNWAFGSAGAIIGFWLRPEN